MSIDKVLDDYKLVIIEGIPIETVEMGTLCKPKEITRDDLLNAIGKETFDEVIKWEEKKEINTVMNIESTNKKTGKRRVFRIYWKHVQIFFEG